MEFWNKFPFNPLPVTPFTPVNIDELEKRVNAVSTKMTWAQKNRAERTISNLKYGASTYQLSQLPACYCKNSKSTFTYGEHVTDTVANWVKQGIVSGPFKSPPLERFRVNPLVAVDQDDKVRLVMNVSLPENESLNDNVDQNLLEKVHMSSARSVSYVIVEAGKGAWLSKMDMRDAYKVLPVPLTEIRLQGFRWLDMYFAETQQIFGAEPSVCNFDGLGKTVQTIVSIECQASERSSPRQLDDTIKINPKNSDECHEFTEKYTSLCKDIGIQLADNCKKFEKRSRTPITGRFLESFSIPTTTLGGCLTTKSTKLCQQLWML